MTCTSFDATTALLDMSTSCRQNMDLCSGSENMVHWVKSRLDRNLNWIFNHGHVKIFEIIQIELTDGHPRTFNLELVSFFTLFIVSVIMFFIRLRSRGSPTTLGPPSTGLQSIWRTIWPGTQTARGNRLSLESRSCEHIHKPVS